MANLAATDPVWKAALMVALEMTEFCDVVYTSYEFFPYSRKFLPPEYSLHAHNENVGFVVHKDAMDRVSPAALAACSNPRQVIYGNDVFLAFVTSEASVPRFTFFDRYFDELVSFRDRVERGQFRKGKSPCLPMHRGREGARRAVVVGASNMGNIGDDLIAFSIGRMLTRAWPGCRVDYCDSRLTAADLRDYDLCIVGGGGIVYARMHRKNAMANLANYFKYPYLCEALRIPSMVLGVGLQGHEDVFLEHEETRRFAIGALQRASLVTVRDERSLSLFKSLGIPSVRYLPDVVFALAGKLRRDQEEFSSSIPSDRGPAVFIGELMRFSFAGESLRYLIQRFSAEGYPLAFALMSNDDESHRDRFVALCKDLVGSHCEVEVRDLRGKSFSRAMAELTDAGSIVTARFHGLVLGLMARRPTLAIDEVDGKKSLLAAEFFPEIADMVVSHAHSAQQLRSACDRFIARPGSFLPSVASVQALIDRSGELVELLRPFNSVSRDVGQAVDAVADVNS